MDGLFWMGFTCGLFPRELGNFRWWCRVTTESRDHKRQREAWKLETCPANEVFMGMKSPIGHNKTALEWWVNTTTYCIPYWCLYMFTHSNYQIGIWQHNRDVASAAEHSHESTWMELPAPRMRFKDRTQPTYQECGGKIWDVVSSHFQNLRNY